MPCEHYRDAIDEMVDGTLGPIRRSELQIHLDQCGGCRALVQDLERIRDLAASLDRPAPPDRVWLQVAGRLRQEGRLQPPSVRVKAPRHHYALLAIAATLVLAVGGSLFLLLPTIRGSRQPAAPAATAQQTPGNAASTDAVQAEPGDIAAEFRLAEQHYQNAIAKLEEAAKSDQGSIDPQTAAMLQKNLQVIDQAIAESGAAMRSEPSSTAARDSLFEALKRKVSLLQDTIALMNEMRKGNAAGASQLVDGINKG
jgi:anti-sigma factor RsiW